MTCYTACDTFVLPKDIYTNTMLFFCQSKHIYGVCVVCYLHLCCQSFFMFFSHVDSQWVFTFGFHPCFSLTFPNPTWLTLCLHLFRCSQQQWPSSRLVHSWCQVSFFILPAVHSILQLSSLRSREGKSGTRRRKRGSKRKRKEKRKQTVMHPITSWSGSYSTHKHLKTASHFSRGQTLVYSKGQKVAT